MAERRFTVRLDAEMNISQVKSAVQNMQTEISKINFPQDIGVKLTGTFDKLTGEIEKFQAISAKGIGSSKDFSQLERSGDKILQLYAQLRNQIQGLGNLSDSQLSKMIPQSALNNIKKASEAYKTYTSTIEKNAGTLEKQKSKVEGARAEITRLEQSIRKTENMKIVANPKDLTELKNSTVQAKNELDGLETEAKQAQAKIEELTAKLKHPEKSKQIATLQQQLTSLEPQIEQARNKYNSLNNQFNNTTTISKQSRELENLRGQLVTAQTNFDNLNNELNELKTADSTALTNLVSALNQIPGINIDQTTTSLEQIQQVIANLSQGEINQLKASFAQAGQQVNGARGQFDQFNQEIDQTRGKVNQLDSQMGEVDMLKSRISYFFGLTNSVYLLRRALTSAMETVKELDKTMTEAAVVTDFSVSDMWEKLPQYTKEASALGATVNDLYGATTLYYQQGLKTNEAMELGVETMKMARIAGMEASEATEAMTAALRGFNMELTEASATKVNDVYSQLAAITAADTSQIATAMEKTASIAASANMEFETTAALLAQIIETTQEAPETAGTAMKTIIARFSEVKELKSQGKTKGEDTEGEEIDVNKIQTALRTVGISMDGFFQGTEGLDSVLLKLAEKWDTLDFQTQRYIATMAAGSRQQSRFIAMMSDYKRTVQLVGEANNSAGASQKQFEKTLDSMEAKLNQLKNEWDRFTMGIADNELIKKGIDLLTGVLKVVNDITDGISGESGLLKSVINLGVAFGGLKLGGLALTKGLGFFLGIGGNGKENINNDIEHSTKMKQAEIEHKKELLYQAEEHKTRLRYLAEEQKAALQATQAEQTAAIQGEYSEKASALEGEYIEAITAAEGEGAEAAAAVESEYQEKFASLESEYTKRQAALDTQILEQELAINTAYAEETMAVNGEIAELEAAIANENLEGAAAVANESAEGAVGTANGIMGFFKNKGKGIGDFFKKNGRAIGWIAAITVSIAAIDGLVNTANKLIDDMNYTIEEKLEDVTVSQEIAQQGLEKTTSELKKFSGAKRDIQDTTRALKDMAKGSAEWVSSIHEIRTQMNDILDSYPELKEYTEIINGVSVLTEEGWEKYEKKLVETQLIQQSTVDALQAQAIVLSSYQAAENLNLNTSSISQKEQQKIKNAQTTGGWIGGVGGGTAGAFAGAKLLGGLGSFAGPVGTVIGAIVGALGGLLVGNLIGSSEVEEGVSLDTINDVALKASKYTLENGEVFSAENADPEEIKQFLIESGIKEGTEDFEELFDYISKNGEEFDEHSKELKLNEAELYAFGEAVGAARAGVLGLNEKESEAYEDLFGLMTTEEYQIQYKIIDSSLSEAYLKSEEARKEIAKAAGYYYDTSSKAYLYSKNGSKVDEKNDFTLERQREILAASKTMTKIMGRVDKTFSNFKATIGTDNTVITTEAISHSADNPTLQKLTYDQLSKIKDLSDDYLDTLSKYDYNDKVNQAIKLQAKTDDVLGIEVGYDWTEYHTSTQYTMQPLPTSGSTSENMTKDLANTYINSGADAVTKAIKEKVDSWDKIEWYKTNLFDYILGGASDNSTWNYELEGTPTYSISNDKFYAAVAADTGLTTDMIKQYDQNDGDLSGYYHVAEAENWKAQIEQYIQDMPFLKTVPAEIAKSFGEKVTYIIDSYELGEYEPKFKKMLNGLFDGVAAENQTQLANILTSLDFTSLTELNGFAAILDEMEGVTSQAKDEFKDFVQELKDAGIAYADIDLEKLISQMEEVQKLVKKLNDLEANESIFFTKEELNTMLNAGLDRDEFVSTVDGYLYLGKNMEELEQTLRESNKILLELQTDALRKKVKTAEFINNDGELSQKDWATTATWTDKQINEALDGMAQAALNAYNKQNDKTYTLNQVNKDIWDEMVKGTPLQGYGFDWARQWMGTTAFGKEKSLEWSKQDEGVQVLLRNWLAEIGDSVINYAGDSGYKAQYEEGLKDVTEQELSLQDSREIYKYWWNSYQTKDEQGQKISEGLLNQRLSEDEYATGIFAQWQDNLEELPAHLRSATVAQKAMALELSKTQQAIKNVSSVAQQFGGILEKGPVAGGQAYYTALGKLTTAMQQAFGDDITQEYAKEAIPYLNDLAAGGERAAAAYLIIAKNAAKAFAIQAKDKYGWNDEDIAEYEIAVNTLFDKIQEDPTAAIDLDQFFLGLGLAELEYEKFVHGITNNPAFATLNIGVAWNESTGSYNTIVPDPDTTKDNGNNDDLLFGTNLSSFFTGLEDGSAKEEEPWENSLDKSYNTYEKINALIRERERLERKYDQLLRNRQTTTDQLIENAEKQIARLKEEADLQEKIKTDKSNEIDDLFKDEENAALAEKYGIKFDKETGAIEIDWDAINAITEQEEGEAVEQLLSEIEGLRDQWDEADAKLDEIADTTADIRSQGKDDYFDLEQTIADALVDQKQKEIDELSELNDQITNTNSAILDAMQQSIDDARQARENQKIEDEITEKQDRLAYLQQDASGAHAIEILELQKEIEEAQEDYTDQLIDQKISELQRQNDEAAEQRADQIAIMKEQLNYYKNNEMWNEVYTLMQNGIGPQGIKIGSNLYNLLTTGNSQYLNKSTLEQMEFVKDINNMAKMAIQWLKVGNSTESLMEFGELKEGETVTFKTNNGDGKEITGTLKENGDIVADGYTYTGVYRGMDGKYVTDEEYKGKRTTPQNNSPVVGNTITNSGIGSNGSNSGTNFNGTNKNKKMQAALNKFLSIREEKLLVEDGIVGPKTIEAFNMFKRGYGMAEEYELDINNPDEVISSVNTFMAELTALLYDISDAKGWGYTLNNDGDNWHPNVYKVIKKMSPHGTSEKLDRDTRHHIYRNYLNYIQNRMGLEEFFSFKTGGLADFTGPAWLDGTRSKPEYILNAEQTKAFFTLVDVLGSLRATPTQNTQNTGDSNYDIDINVESIGSDYDLEQISRKIEEMIVNSSRYRNNNVL